MDYYYTYSRKSFCLYVYHNSIVHINLSLQLNVELLVLWLLKVWILVFVIPPIFLVIDDHMTVTKCYTNMTHLKCQKTSMNIRVNHKLYREEGKLRYLL
jgi:uncharacterized membrane protein